MPSKYDNWERLVGAVVKREQLRQIALMSSIDSFTFISSSRFDDMDAIDDISMFERSVSIAGKVVFLPVEARELEIHTNELRDGQLPYSYRYNSEAIEINSGLSFDIRGKIKTHLLTSKTIYGAYLVFKLYSDKSIGNDSAKAMITFGEDDSDVDAERQAKIVSLQPSRRGDGWMELQIGCFYVDYGDDREVEARLMATSGCLKTGLIVEGIELKPLESVNYLN